MSCSPFQSQESVSVNKTDLINHSGSAHDGGMMSLTQVAGLGPSAAALHPRHLSPGTQLDLLIHLRLQTEETEVGVKSENTSKQGFIAQERFLIELANTDNLSGFLQHKAVPPVCSRGSAAF